MIARLYVDWENANPYQAIEVDIGTQSLQGYCNNLNGQGGWYGMVSQSEQAFVPLSSIRRIVISVPATP